MLLFYEIILLWIATKIVDSRLNERISNRCKWDRWNISPIILTATHTFKIQLCFTQFSTLFLFVKLCYANLFIFSGWYSIYRRNYYYYYFFTFFNSQGFKKKSKISIILHVCVCNVSSCYIWTVFMIWLFICIFF